MSVQLNRLNIHHHKRRRPPGYAGAQGRKCKPVDESPAVFVCGHGRCAECGILDAKSPARRREQDQIQRKTSFSCTLWNIVTPAAKWLGLILIFVLPLASLLTWAERRDVSTENPAITVLDFCDISGVLLGLYH